MRREEQLRQVALAEQHAGPGEKAPGSLAASGGTETNNASGGRKGQDIQGYSRYNYTAPRQKSSSSRIVAIVIAVVVVVALVGAFVAFGLPALTGSQKAATNTSSSATNANASNSAVSNLSDQKAATNTAPAATSTNSAEAERTIVLTLYGDENTIVLKGEDYLEPGAHAVENYSSDITSSIVKSGTVDTSKTGDYTITYTATSSTGLTLTRTRNVKVVGSMDKATQVPVLMYHYVYSADDPPETLDNNYILDTDLEAQLQYLTQNDYYYPSYQELRAFVDGKHSLPQKSVVLTFDDGEMGCLHYGALMLEKYKVPATSFLVGIDNIEPHLGSASPYIIFQSHSYNMHRGGGTQGLGGVISAMTQEEIAADLQKNIDLLGSADAFAYPFGDTTDEGKAAVKQVGILCAFTTNYDYVHIGDDPTALSRIRVLGSYDLETFISSLG